MIELTLSNAINGDVLYQEMIDAGLPLTDDEIVLADGNLRVPLDESHREDAQAVVDAHTLPPPPPDVDNLLLAAFASTDQGGLGRQKARELIREYPDLQTALDKKNWTIARQALEDAKTDNILTDTQYNTLISLFDEYNIPAA